MIVVSNIKSWYASDLECIVDIINHIDPEVTRGWCAYILNYWNKSRYDKSNHRLYRWRYGIDWYVYGQLQSAEV